MRTSWPVFLIQVWPVASELLRALHRWTKGDVNKAKAQLARIRDHGFRLDEAEAAVDARIEAVRKREES